MPNDLSLQQNPQAGAMPMPQAAQLEQAEIDINQSVLRVDAYVRKNHLSLLGQACPDALPPYQAMIRPGENLRLLRVSRLSRENDDPPDLRLSSLFAALATQNTTLAYVLNAQEDQSKLYYGVACDDRAQLSMAFRTLTGAVEGNLPGCRYQPVRAHDHETLLEQILPHEPLCVASVSVAPCGERETASLLPQNGMERLLDTLRGSPFSMIVLSRVVPVADLINARRGYETLYTQLSQFQRIDRSVNLSQTASYAHSVSESVNESITYSNSTTDSATRTHGVSESASLTPNAANARRQAGLQMAGAAAGTLAAALTGGFPVVQGLFMGQSLGGMVENLLKASGPDANGERATTTQGTHDDESAGTSVQRGESEARGTATTDGITHTNAGSSGITRTMSQQNKSVMELLDLIDRQIQHLKRLESVAAFDTCAYFIAADPATANMAANSYRTLLTGGDRHKDAMPINLWTEESPVSVIFDHLRRMLHPTFRFEDVADYPHVSPAQTIGAADLSRVMCLPQKDVPGLQVAECARFSRDIPETPEFADERLSFSVGRILHMGKPEPTEVRLLADQLTSHLFVSGMTGMGKSNFCYLLVDELVRREKKVLVIEPAKGEYRKVFGGREDFHVYGTNPFLATPLRINPFAFPQGVHVSEHIDRLLSILSACWSMYAAMPAMLKDAMEECYTACGYDLATGLQAGAAGFPCFDDLLRVLPRVIQRSDYSGEVKGNYSGALISRVKSLANGIYRQIFVRRELGDEALFDENVLVDLSRVGSSETKALLMGVLVMRLNEHRMCQNRMNSALRHVTFLEEAHHLLRANARAASEGANVQAAATEMITNAIAELRTYGEGFVIADQAPGMMDPSVIRNTYTKVAFKLPDLEDRLIVGRAMALTDRQITHLAMLDKGVAAIYQGGWGQAALCATAYFDPSRFRPDTELPARLPMAAAEPDDRLAGQAVAILLKHRITGDAGIKEERIRNFLDGEPDPGTVKGALVRDICRSYRREGAPLAPPERLLPMLDTLLDYNALMAGCDASPKLSLWVRSLYARVRDRYDIGYDVFEQAMDVCMGHFAAAMPKRHRLYAQWIAFRQTTKEM